jgi:exodeoxyribonuclease III
MVSIVSWNVNGVRSAETKGLFGWLSAESPDILCLQETKASPEQLTANFHAPTDGSGKTYRAYWASAKRRGYSGVALYTREEPKSVAGIGIAEYDDEGRALVADYGDFVLIGAYFPNSQEEGARLAYKLGFCAAIKDTCDRLVKEGRHVVVCGDYNIAHKPIDLANPKSNEGNPGYLPEERAWMDVFTGSGYVDTFRSFCAEPKQYTWWTYRFHAREKNVGWRLDYHCTDEGFMNRVVSSEILKDVTGSDHCPVKITLN